MKKQQLFNFLKFLIFIICFCIIPLLLILLGYYYTWQKNEKTLIKNLSNKVSSLYSNLALFSDQQKFWYLLFQNKIENSSNQGKNTQETLKNHAKAFEDLNKIYDFDYIVYHPDYGLIASMSPDTLGGNINEQKIAINYVYKYKIFDNFACSTKTEEILGKVFGPQFYVENLKIKTRLNRGLHLCWTDSQYKKKLIWSSDSHGCLSLAFIKQEDLNNIIYIKKYLDNLNKEINFDINFSIKDDINDKFLHPNFITDKQKEEIESADKNYKNNRALQIETNNYFIFPKFLRAGVTIYGYFNKNLLTNTNPSFCWNVIILLFILISIYLARYGWKIIILNDLDNISIKHKLAFLLFFANGLPLLVLIFIGNEFLNNARADYIQKILEEGNLFLQDFDEKYDLEYARCIIRKEKIKNELQTNSNKSDLNLKDLDRLYNEISSHTWALFLVASSGRTLMKNSDGIFEYDKNGNSIKNKYSTNTKIGSRRSRDINNQMDFAKKLGHFLLSRLNNTPLEEKKAAEFELLAEATLRKKADSFIFELIEKLGNFIPLGLGHNVHQALLDHISLSYDNNYDYFILATIRTKEFQRDYLEKAIIQANRNEIGLKIISWNNENLFIPASEESSELNKLIKKINAYPLDNAVILNHKKIDYIAMGFDCKHLEKCKIIGLYPLEKIDKYVENRRKELLIITILSILMTIFLSSILIRSFLTPLSEINLGVKAFKEKNFQYRLPNLGRNEFGDISNIFNEVAVDLEELSVASAIQEQLLPNSTIKSGYFSIYGKSVTMSELGGDYFDFIEMEEDKFSIAMGDVAGHGVGASLIMAMAKAALISLDELWKEPQKLICRLHDMIYKSKTANQKKIMTFQYMQLDGKSGQAIYSNAGGCSPFIVRKKQNQIEELKLPGAVLGSFKKAKFSQTNLEFDNGDAIVFYTDGIVECKNQNGIMLGYNNLKNIIQNCWNENAEIFYKNIYNKYIEYIGGSESNAVDDLTIVVLVFNKPTIV